MSKFVRSPDTLSKEQPRPDALGEFLIANLVKPKQKFNIEEERLIEVVSCLPENLRDMVKGWIVVYLAWLFKVYTLKRHGKEFMEKLLAVVQDRLQKISDDKIKELWPTLEYWFTNLDKARCGGGKAAADWEVPFEVYAALCFMVFDKESPYYKNPSAETNMIEFDIGFILGSAAREAKQTIQEAIDLGDSAGNEKDC